MVILNDKSLLRKEEAILSQARSTFLQVTSRNRHMRLGSSTVDVALVVSLRFSKIDTLHRFSMEGL